MITLCLTYFRSLTLRHLDAALYSVRQQDLSFVEKIVIVDNNTEDSPQRIWSVVNDQHFSVDVMIVSSKHGNENRTHSWSTNAAIREARTPWVFFTRADYILDFDTLDRFWSVVETNGGPSNHGFVTANTYHLHVDIAAVENTHWRAEGARVLQRLPGTPTDYGDIDTGVWLGSKAAFDAVGGLDEGLTVWGHAQTHFQWKLFQCGIRTSCFSEAMLYHPLHDAPRDINVANKQLTERGIDLRAMWQRHTGRNPYA